MLLCTILLHSIFCMILFSTATSVILTSINSHKKTQDFSADHELQTISSSSALTRTTFKVKLGHWTGRKVSTPVAPVNLVLMKMNPDHHDVQKEAHVTSQHLSNGLSNTENFPVFLSPQSGPFSKGIYHRRDRFYYCGPKNNNSCRSLCYAYGYPKIECGRISCYCTW